MKTKLVLLFMLSAFCLNAFAAIPGSDTRGKVSAVKVLNSNHNAFLIYFSSTENDANNCIINTGFMKVRENGVGVTPKIYDEIYSMALAALASGKTLGLDSAGSSPCENVNSSAIYN